MPENPTNQPYSKIDIIISSEIMQYFIFLV